MPSNAVPISSKVILKWGLLWPIIIISIFSLPILFIEPVTWCGIIAIFLLPYSVAAPFVYKKLVNCSFDELIAFTYKLPYYHTLYYSVFIFSAEMLLGLYQFITDGAKILDALPTAVLIMFFSAPFTLAAGYVFAYSYRQKVLSSIKKNKIIIVD